MPQAPAGFGGDGGMWGGAGWGGGVGKVEVRSGTHETVSALAATDFSWRAWAAASTCAWLTHVRRRYQMRSKAAQC